MKRVFALLVIFALLLCTACSADVSQTTDPIETTQATEATQPTEHTKPGAEIFNDELKAKLDAVLEQNKYDGIVSLTCNGETVYQWVKGSNEMGEPLTVESPMLIGSVSKHFCAAAILKLRDEWKLSLDDTLEKYFPAYTNGKDITLQQMLSMRSGIPRDVEPMWVNGEQYQNNTAEENEAIFKEWIFDRPLNFTPGTDYEYSNVNYTFLSYVVEMVSGEDYHDYLRKNFFEPLGMTNTGFIHEIKDNPQWGFDYATLAPGSQTVYAITQGCGEIVTTAGDIDIWMTALRSGQVVSEESFREMTTDYAAGYGYGMMRYIRGSWGHGGNITTYNTHMSFNEEYGYNVYLVSNQATAYRGDITNKTATAFLRTLYEAADAASK